MESTNDFSSNKKTSNGDNQQVRFDGYGWFLGMCLALWAISAGLFLIENLQETKKKKQKIQKQEFAREILNDYRIEQTKGKAVNIDSLIN